MLAGVAGFSLQCTFCFDQACICYFPNHLDGKVLWSYHPMIRICNLMRKRWPSPLKNCRKFLETYEPKCQTCWASEIKIIISWIKNVVDSVWRNTKDQDQIKNLLGNASFLITFIKQISADKYWLGSFPPQRINFPPDTWHSCKGETLPFRIWRTHWIICCRKMWIPHFAVQILVVDTE